MQRIHSALGSKKSRFEPQDLCLNKRKNTALGGVRPDWLSIMREFRTAIKEYQGYWKFKIVREWQI